VKELCTRPQDVFAFIAGSDLISPTCQLFLSLPTFSLAGQLSALHYLFVFLLDYLLTLLVFKIYLRSKKWSLIAKELFRVFLITHFVMFFLWTQVASVLKHEIGVTLFGYFVLSALWRSLLLVKKFPANDKAVPIAVFLSLLMAWLLRAFPEY